MEFGAIKQQKLESPLEQLATVRASSKKVNILRLAAPLMITSLVDAFAVIVIYLLVSTKSTNFDLKVDKDIKLPQAKNSKVLQPGLSLRVSNNSYIVNDKTYSIKALVAHLNQMNEDLTKNNDKRKGNLIIQADKESDFENVSPLLEVASQTGFVNVRFAVIGE
jgi:biopolymer transport protein ExbD